MRKTVFLFFLLNLFWGTMAFAGFSEIMSSTNYKINPDSVNAGGEDSSVSDNYSLKDTVGEDAGGLSKTALYFMKAGYRQASYPCNYNEICDSGEDSTECSTDCGCNNNNVCQSYRGENLTNCFADCYKGGPEIPTGDTTAPTIFNIFVRIEELTNNSAKIYWETSEQTMCRLYLGRTLQYEEQSIEEVMFYYNRIQSISDLSEGTLYHFKISCRDTNYNSSQTGDFTFKTLGLDTEPPSNVSDLESEGTDKEVILKWDNPPEFDFEEIIIVRNENFYPKNPSDGEIVYRGKDILFVDKNVEKGKRYYYTVFSYDKVRNYSSGAVISDGAREPGQELPPIPELPPTEPVIPEVQELSLKDFDFFLNKKQIFLTEDNKLEASIGKNLAVFLKYAKAPEVLKTIMVTLKKGEKYFSFLLKATDDKEGFIATISTPEESGIYPLDISVFDYKNQKLKKVSGELVVKPEPVKEEKEPGLAEKAKEIFLQRQAFFKLLLLLVFAMLIRVLTIGRAERPDTDVARDFSSRSNNQSGQLDSGLEGKSQGNIGAGTMTDQEGNERKDFPNFKL